MEVLIVAGALVALALYESEKKSESPSKPDLSDDNKVLVPPTGTGSAPVVNPPDSSSQPPATSSTTPVSVSSPIALGPATPVSVASPIALGPPVATTIDPTKVCMVSGATGPWLATQATQQSCASLGTLGAYVSYYGSYDGKYSPEWVGQFYDPNNYCPTRGCNTADFPK